MNSRYQHNWLYASVLLLLVCCSHNASAQALDSLLHALNKNVKEDTTKVDLYAAVASVYRNVSTDSMVAVARRGVLLADRLHFEKGRARCLASLGVAYMFKNDLDPADSLCNAAIAILEQTKDSTGMIPLLYYLGNIRYRQTKYKEAIGYFEKSVRCAEKKGDLKAAGKSLDNIGVSYSVLGNNTEALNYFLKALKVWEKIGYNPGKGTTLSSIARMYVVLGDNAKAVNYMNQSLAVQQSYGNVQATIQRYLNAVGVYTAAHNDSTAIALCTEGIRLADSTGQRSELALLLVDRGMSYFEAGDYDKAFADYSKCLEPSDDKPSPAMIAQAHMGLGEIWMARGDARKSIPHLETAYVLFRENEMDDQTGPTADSLGVAYAKIGEYQKALKFTKIGHAIKDSLFNEKNTKQQQQLQFDYELEKKQNQIGMLEKDKLIAQARSEKQRSTSWGLVAGLVLVMVIAIQLYRGRIKEKRSKETITRQANNLEDMNKFKDKIFSVLSHDLRGPINSISTTVDMMDEGLLSPAEFTELKPEMKKQLGALTFLLDNLLKWSKNYIIGVATARPERIGLYKIARENINLLQVHAREKNITITNSIPDTFTANGDPGQIDIVVRNLISNALKFTDIGGTITLSASREGDTARIHISDTGIGMTPEQVKRLFMAATHTSTHGTIGETGTGLGLLLCYEFVKANKGEIIVESEVTKGTTFTVVLPG